MNTPYVFKRCNKCGEWLVAYKGNFSKKKRGKYELNGQCKLCIKQYQEINKEQYKEKRKIWYEKNKNEVLIKQKDYRDSHKKEKSESDRKYREKNKEKISMKQKQYYEINKEKIVEYKKEYYEINKEKIDIQNKIYTEKNKEHLSEYYKLYRDEHKEDSHKYSIRYRNNNKEKLLEYKKQYYKENKEKILEQKKKYREENREKVLELKRNWYKTPQGQVSHINSDAKRRLRERNQGIGITKEQWMEMMHFFNWKCAYSGISLTKENRSIDHVEPISSGGRHEVWNCVPMFVSYNISKNNKDMINWYKQQDFYSEERLQKIYEWQEYSYNKWSCQLIDVEEA